MITVLRLEHRVGRDKRMTTHCALAARALGADRMVYTGDHDSKMEENIESVVERWGGCFKVEHRKNWESFLKNFEGKRIYLSMYGLPVESCIDDVKDYDRNLCVVVGGEKVPGDIYNYIDTQIAVTNQPHSEVAALAVFLDRLHEDKEVKLSFDDGSIEVVPKKTGKDVKEDK